MEKIKKETVVPLGMKQKEIVVRVVVEIVPQGAAALQQTNNNMKSDLKNYMAAVKSAREDLEQENAELRVEIERLRQEVRERERQND